MTPDDERLIGEVLRAAVDGPFFPDWEFPTLMGLDRVQMRAVAEAWPKVTDPASTDLAINNAFAHLLGYPHNDWASWSTFSSASRMEVSDGFNRWREGSSFGPLRVTLRDAD